MDSPFAAWCALIVVIAFAVVTRMAVPRAGSLRDLVPARPRWRLYSTGAAFAAALIGTLAYGAKPDAGEIALAAFLAVVFTLWAALLLRALYWFEGLPARAGQEAAQ